MKKRVKPLNAERTRSRSGKGLFSLNKENAWLSLPFAEISPRLKLNLSDRAKRLALRLDPHNRVMHLVVPKRSSMRTAYLFAEQHKDWIREKLRDLPKPVPFRDGEVLPIMGRDRRIIILFNEAATAARVACIGLIVAGIFGLKLVSSGT